MAKKIKRRICLCLTAILMFCFLSCPVFASTVPYEIPEVYLQIEIPDNFIVLTQKTSIFDAIWLDAEIDNPSEKLEEYQELGTLVNLISPDNKYGLMITQTSSAESEALFNLKNVDDAAFEEYMETLADTSGAEDVISATSSRYDGNKQLPYVRLDMSYIPEAGQPLYEICFITVVNGLSIMIDLYSPSPITEAQEEVLLSLVNSANFTIIFTENEIPDVSTRDVLLALSPFFLLLFLIVLLIIILVLRHNAAKKQRIVMADKLSAYRLKLKDSTENFSNIPAEEVLFYNKTVHSDEALRIYSYFQAYFKNLFTIPLYLIFAVLAGLVGLYISDNFFISLFFLAISIFLLIRVFILPNSIAKVLYRTYKAIPNRTAQYVFREEDFRISGLQATGIFPYFQISAAYETKDYFFLYFGKENAYFVKKSAFSVGDAVSFRKFLKERLGKNFKNRCLF